MVVGSSYLSCVFRADGLEILLFPMVKESWYQSSWGNPVVCHVTCELRKLMVKVVEQLCFETMISHFTARFLLRKSYKIIARKKLLDMVMILSLLVDELLKMVLIDYEIEKRLKEKSSIRAKAVRKSKLGEALQSPCEAVEGSCRPSSKYLHVCKPHTSGVETCSRDAKQCSIGFSEEKEAQATR
eukprot:Gb_30398 [translate_table: standard]